MKNFLKKLGRILKCRGLWGGSVYGEGGMWGQGGFGGANEGNLKGQDRLENMAGIP